VTEDVLPDPETAFGKRVRTRLREAQVIWLSTVAADGTPQPNPVWFLWQSPDTVLIYNRADAHRLTHLRQRPQVSLNFDGNGEGNDIVVLAGTAELAPDEPAAHENAAYLDKYAAAAERISGDVATFSTEYSVALRVRVRKARGF
jgi:PPOX class probable F420-dependent enzyme